MGGIVGRPTKARDKLRNNFMAALADDFVAHGTKAIQDAREKDPLGYIKVCAGLMPKEIELTRPLDDIPDDQLDAAVIAVRAIFAAQDSGAGAKTSGQPQPAEELSAVSKAG